MRNLKKRILSFVSAVAMVATMLPTTGLFASAETEYSADGTSMTVKAVDSYVNKGLNVTDTAQGFINANGSGNIDIKFEIPEDGTYNIKLRTLIQADSYSDVKVVQGEEKGKTQVYSNNGDWQDQSKILYEQDVDLVAGECAVNIYTDGCYINIFDVIVTAKNGTPFIEEEGSINTGIQLTARVNDPTLGSIDESEFQGASGGTLKATATGDNVFVGWTVRTMSDKTGVKIGSNETLKITSKAVADKINQYSADKENKDLYIFANFAQMKKYRYEAENFVHFISETYYKDHGNYDDPTIVLDDNKGYTQGETATETVYDADNKFSDGHKAGEAGSGNKETVASIDNGVTMNFDKNGEGKYQFNNGDGNWNDSTHSATIVVPEDAKNPYVEIKGYVKGWVNVKVDDPTGSPIFNPADGMNGAFVTGFDAVAGHTYTVYFIADSGEYNGEGKYADVNTINVLSDKESTGGEIGKIENWTNKSYSDLNVAPKYSNGQAVALTGPSNGVAIPFALNEAISVNMDIELGYNYGTLDDQYKNDTSGPWQGGLWVNLYYIGENYADFEKAVSAGGWLKSDNATPDAASETLQANGKPAGNAYYYWLDPQSKDGAATYLDGSLIPGTDDARSSDQRTIISLPNGLPEGKYMLSVATDENNGLSSETKLNNYPNSERGTAYYDYIQFQMPDDPTQPDAFSVGADFTYTDIATGDKMKNSLKINSFSETKFDTESKQMLFSPDSPEYLAIQGYNFMGWEIKDDGNTVYHYLNNTDDAKYAGVKDAGANYSDSCKAINKLAYPAGAKIEFIAHYEFKQEDRSLTIKDGHFYIAPKGKDPSDVNNYTKELDNSTVVFQNFDKVRLVANDTDNFSYWTLNGMIYSYDPDIFVSVWLEGDFVAVSNKDTAEAVAYIDGANAVVSGFDGTNNVPNKQKISFFAEFGIKGSNDSWNSNAVKNAQVGVIVSSAKGHDGLKSLQSGGNLTVPAGCVNITNQNDNNIVNNEIFFALYNANLGKDYYARAYIIYNGNVYYSNNIAYVKNAGITNDRGVE